MKRFLPALALLYFLPFAMMGQPASETEPNDGFATANRMAQDTVIQGTVGQLNDPNDYFWSIPGDDGTLHIEVIVQTAANGNDFYLRMYNKRKGLIGSADNINAVQGINDTVPLTIHCVAQDTVYFNVQGNGAFSYDLSYTLTPSGVKEPEPNNAFTEAVALPFGDTARGRIDYTNYFDDQFDYFYTILPDDGTLEVTLDVNNTSGSSDADLYLNVYNKRRGLIAKVSDANTPTGAGQLTVTAHCVAADTVYFRIQASGCYSYDLSYNLTPSGIKEPEPNNDFPAAVALPFGDTARGRIDYTNYFDDQFDYFYTILPDDGTLEVTLDVNNTSGSSDADLYLNVYNKRRGLIANVSDINTPTGAGQLTVTAHCVAADTVYFRIQANGCYSYDLSYNLTPSGVKEPEPNNDFPAAVALPFGDTARGRIDYTNYFDDQFDYFYTILPDDGTLEVTLDVNNTSGSSDADLYLNVYDKKRGLIANVSDVNTPTGAGQLIVTEHCVAADTVYFRIQASGCYSYHLSYTLTPSGVKEPEPNNDFPAAVALPFGDTARGRIDYTNYFDDQFDYFYTILPDDGTLEVTLDVNNTSGSSGADIYLNVYNKRRGLIANVSDINTPTGAGQLTVTAHCVAADTVYFRIQASGCYSYDLSYTLTPSGIKEPEPNNDFPAAVALPFGDTARGRIDYTNYFDDQFDYFYTILPDDGTLEVTLDVNNTSGSSGADIYLNVYNKRRGLIANVSDVNTPTGAGQLTVTEHCVAADTVYFRIQANGCYSYDLSYTLSTSGSIDSEPNNTQPTAQTIQLTDTVWGRIGYVNYFNDGDDYFKFQLDTLSTIALPLNITNTSNSTGADFYFRLRNAQGSAVFAQNYTNMRLSGVQDTITINCLPAGEYYIQVLSTGCFAYQMHFEPTPQQPLAQIIAANTGSLYGLEAVVNAQTDVYSWDLGDGTTSTLQHERKNYGIGQYDIILTASNQACNLTVRDTLPITVKGIEYFTPDHAGSGGDMVMQVYGGGLDTFTQIVLTDPNGNSLQPTQKWANQDGTAMQAFFDLHFADPGLYDVDITIPGEPVAQYPDGFEVDSFEYPYTLSYITGPDRWRTNRNTRFILNVTNKGNVNASGVVVWMVWPKSVEVEFDTEWFRPPSSGKYTIDFEDSIIEFDYADIQSFYDSAFMVPTPIDSFAGEPFDGYAFSIMIGAIPPGSIYEIPFYAKSGNPSNIVFETYTIKPNLFGSCGSTSQYDMWQNGAVEAIDWLDQGLGLAKMDKTPLGWLTKAVKATTTHMANLGQAMGAASLVADGTYDNIYQAVPAGYDAQVSAGNWQMAKAGMDLAIDKAVDVGADQILRGHQNNVNEWVLNNPNAKINSALLASDQLSTINDIRQFVKDAYSQGKNAKWVAEKLERLGKAAVDCPELQKQIEELKKNVDKDMHQRDKRKKRTRSVNSMDPNAIYGPPGVDTMGYIQTDYRHSFIAMFENVDTASADAQVVHVSVPIDTQAYDLSSFAFGDVAIGGHVFNIPENRQSFITDVEVPYRPDLIIRVLGYVDTITGTAHWRFTSLDSNTMALPLLEGFLPPNKIAPQGEGSVEFAITLRDDVQNGYTIATQANIVFDQNAPILTNTWYNTVDITPGNSHVTASTNGRLINLTMSGNDSLSGIGYYNIYFSEDGGPWVAMAGTSEHTLSIEGIPGASYDIYVESVDRVGNEETKTPMAEASVIISDVEITQVNPLRIYPNPNFGQMFIQSDVAIPQGQMRLMNLQGQTVYATSVSIHEGATVQVSVPQLAPGPYLITVQDDNGALFREMILLQ